MFMYVSQHLAVFHFFLADSFRQSHQHAVLILQEPQIETEHEHILVLWIPNSITHSDYHATSVPVCEEPKQNKPETILDDANTTLRVPDCGKKKETYVILFS